MNYIFKKSSYYNRITFYIGITYQDVRLEAGNSNLSFVFNANNLFSIWILRFKFHRTFDSFIHKQSRGLIYGFGQSCSVGNLVFFSIRVQ